MRLIIFNDFVQEKTFTETSWGPLAYQFVPHEHILSLLDPKQRGSCPKLCLLSIRDDARTVTRWRPTWCRHQQKSSGIVLQLLRLRSDKCKKSDCLRMIHSLNCLPCQANAWCEYVWFVWFVWLAFQWLTSALWQKSRLVWKQWSKKYKYKYW